MVSFVPEGEPVPGCNVSIAGDSSHGTLHVARVAFDGSAPREVLVMPVDRPAGALFYTYTTTRPVDVRGFGKDLAIGLHTGGTADAVRVMRVDTTSL
jgi:hypothetical protein